MIPATRLKFLSESNVPPTEYESMQVAEMISEEESRFKELDREFTAARAVFERLELQHSKCASGLLKHRPILSPIRRVPPEIVREIFLHVVDLELENPSYGSLKAPLLLGHISSVWRQISLEFPKLWTHVLISFNNKNYKRMMIRAKAWLDRAKALPLSLTVCPEAETTVAHLSRMMDVLHPYLPRCKRLYIDLVYFFIPALSTIHCTLPLLEHLELKLTYLGLDYGRTYVLKLFDDAPRLKRVEFLSSHPVRQKQIRNLNLPWSQLTHLEMRDYFHDPRHPFIFSQCVNLEHCTLYPRTKARGNSANASQTVLPRLQDLYLIDQARPSKTQNVVDTLTLPPLQAFSYAGKSQYYDFPMERFLDLHARSHFSLVSLSITSLSLETVDFTILFLTMPSLVSLALRSCACPPRIVHALTYTEGDSGLLLPSLQELIVGYNDDFILPCPLFEPKNVADMVGSRWWPDTDLFLQRPIARLRKVKVLVDGWSSDCESVAEKIKRYQEEGLDVEISQIKDI